MRFVDTSAWIERSEDRRRSFNCDVSRKAEIQIQVA